MRVKRREDRRRLRQGVFEETRRKASHSGQNRLSRRAILKNLRRQDFFKGWIGIEMKEQHVGFTVMIMQPGAGNGRHEFDVDLGRGQGFDKLPDPATVPDYPEAGPIGQQRRGLRDNMMETLPFPDIPGI